MLKVYAHIYSDNVHQEEFEEVLDALREAGYTLAYDSDTNVTIIKEEPNEE